MVGHAYVIVEDKDGNIVRVKKTDESGVARIPIYAGYFVVHVIKPRHYPDKDAITVTGDTTLVAHVTPLQNVKIQLGTPPHQPVANAFIIVEDLSIGTLYAKKTDIEGKATFKLKAGEYKIVAYAEGYAVAEETVTLAEDTIVTIYLGVVRPYTFIPEVSGLYQPEFSNLTVIESSKLIPQFSNVTLPQSSKLIPQFSNATLTQNSMHKSRFSNVTLTQSIVFISTTITT